MINNSVLICCCFSGWLCDQTNDYNLSFYLAGLFIVLSGVLLIIVPLMNRYKRFMRQTSEQSSSSIENGEETLKTSKNILSSGLKTDNKFSGAQI